MKRFTYMTADGERNWLGVPRAAPTEPWPCLRSVRDNNTSVKGQPFSRRIFEASIAIDETSLVRQ